MARRLAAKRRTASPWDTGAKPHGLPEKPLPPSLGGASDMAQAPGVASPPPKPMTNPAYSGYGGLEAFAKSPQATQPYTSLENFAGKAPVWQPGPRPMQPVAAQAAWNTAVANPQLVPQAGQPAGRPVVGRQPTMQELVMARQRGVTRRGV